MIVECPIHGEHGEPSCPSCWLVLRNLLQDSDANLVV